MTLGVNHMRDCSIVVISITPNRSIGGNLIGPSSADFWATAVVRVEFRLPGVVVLVVVTAADTDGVFVGDASKFKIEPEHSWKFCKAPVPMRSPQSDVCGSLQPPM